MLTSVRTIALGLGSLAWLAACWALAQDWPQWRGPNRDGKAIGFEAPDTWPEELTQKWRVTVGEGPATPALVGDRLYVFSRQNDHEIVRCLDADTGDEIWKDQYPVGELEGGASNQSGPRSSPLVADGKVVTLGAEEVLSCYDAASGELLWRNDDFQGDGPMFYTASSPILVDGLCVVQLGGVVNGNGFIIAFDLASGEEKWRWTGEHPAYGSPVVVTIGGTKAIITTINQNFVAVDASDGTQLWKMPTSHRNNAPSPIVDGERLVIAGPGTGMTAMHLGKVGDGLDAEPVWENTDNSLAFNTPVLKDGLLFGVSNGNQLFCINAQTGETEWTVSASGDAAAEQSGQGRRGGGRGGFGGFGSIVDAGSVMLGVTSSGPLVVFEPGPQFKRLASYNVSDSQIHAHPIAADNRIYIKDEDSVTLWTVE